ncbi:MAG: 3-isopropylmalate dehydratase large subunit [Sandaracinaceae bacterium]|jgi:3-isopropylmalate/(R)-2-methylmalate dehydratase large subunit|nr:3-isopropylmalate dehydratase large subunit [Sandaracinaceae bacterium]MBK7777732.1 3-isopropylmalate dehydratase large subunit [Sandaracinaceae bacterium]MBK8410648.1 3-isopropylmalate dehydratase large subunit [Sandaracinaceae bacterium]
MSASQKQPKTLFQKVWEQHVVAEEEGCPAVLYIDLHLIHEVTSPQAFTGLRERGLKARRPENTLATMDHSTPTDPKKLKVIDAQAAAQLDMLTANCAEFGITLYGLGNLKNGIVHVVGPERGLTQPGKTIVCGDSHTSTHGAFGALAFGIGTSEVEHVLASQCLLQTRPKTLEVRVEGKLAPGVTAKDIILALCAKIGVGGATGYVIEYTGSAIRDLSMQGRMTVCNMSIEAGARAGMIAPDEKTFEFIEGREFAPKGADWDAAVARWKQLPSDPGATYDALVEIDAASLTPMITYGTNPGMGMGVGDSTPLASAFEGSERAAYEKAMDYMGITPGDSLLGHKVDVVFIGSCTNSRIEDLRDAASIFKGRKVQGVRTLVVPGSHDIKHQAEAEGLDKIFVEAGAEWREPGCSMCIAMNGDNLEPGQYAVSTSNRNFEGRQGKGGRTILASPLTAAAAAVTGKVTDVRELLG